MILQLGFDFSWQRDRIEVDSEPVLRDGLCKTMGLNLLQRSLKVHDPEVYLHKLTGNLGPELLIAEILYSSCI